MATDKLLSTWDASKQQSWRGKNPDQALAFHFLLDASPSMVPYADDLMKAYNMYAIWLRHTVHPMSMAQVSSFSSTLSLCPMLPIARLSLLIAETYQPRNGELTALYEAVGRICTEARQPGQHILIVFSDGDDNDSDPERWTAGKVSTLLSALQDHDHWLAVYLGAFEESLETAKAMGFREGNTLTFAADKIAEAFKDLQYATQKYLTAAPGERKLLAQGGIF